MGVEYAHWLFIEDLTWTATSDTAERVVDALRRWGIGDRFVVADLDRHSPHSTGSGVDVEVLGFVDEVGSLPENALLDALVTPTGGEVARVVGDSLYFGGEERESRYLQKVSLVLGTDFRISDHDEAHDTLVLEPAKDLNGHPTEVVEVHYRGLRPTANLDQAEPLGLVPGCLGWRLYRSPPAVTPPVTEVEWHTDTSALSESGFTGCFRGALLLDCGKDLPQMADGYNPLPNRSFVEDLERAFRTTLTETGIIY